jgi:hypothetical protein
MTVDDDGPSDPYPRPRFVPAGSGGPPAAPILGATTTPWVLDLIRRYRAAGPTMRVCIHLAQDPDEGAVWQSRVPDLRSCRRPDCTGAVLAALRERLGHPEDEEPVRCTTCGRAGVAVRGVGVAVGPTMLRGTVCEDCLAARPVPTASAGIDPAAPAAAGTRRALEPGDAPLRADAEDDEPAAADGRPPLDAVGRRALRRGWLLAEACAAATATGLDPDRAVMGGLLVRAAKLAEGLAGPAPAGGALAHDLAFRSLVETTTLLWWLVRADPAEAAASTAAFRGDGDARRGPGDARDRLAVLGREADLATLLGPTADAVPGSWPELRALHLADREDGFALDLGRPDADPLRALVAGEHLSLACADYVDRMPTDLDPDHLRRLAEEVTELRADVEATLREASAESGDGGG